MSHRASVPRRLLAALLVSPLFAWPLAAEAARVLDRVAAVVGEEVILESEVVETASLQTPPPSGDSAEAKRAWSEAKHKALEMMINNRLIEAQATEMKIAVTADQVERAIQQVKEQNKLDDASFTEALRQQGITMEAYRKTIKKQLVEYSVLSQAVRARVTVSDDEVRAYYRQNERTLGDRQAHLRQIVIALPRGATHADEERRQAVARQVFELAKGGTSFAALAAKYSDDESSKAEGGDLGFVEKGNLVEPLEQAVAEMQPGEVRGPLRIDRGWVIVQLVERKAGDLRPFAEVKEQIRRQLYDQQVEKATQAWLKELRKKAHVDVRL